MEIVLNPFIGTIFNLFLISALVITMYTLNFYYLVLLSSRRIANEDVVAFKADSVTIHLPIYNEKYVAARYQTIRTHLLDMHLCTLHLQRKYQSLRRQILPIHP